MRSIGWFIFGLVASGWLAVREVNAGTLVTMYTTLGDMELELYDDDKPVTVSNFLKYITSGRYHNLLLQRWEPNFVIQAGQYWVDTNDPAINNVPVYGQITNEFSVGTKYLNTYGTIAMARIPRQTNSAGSQWFLNLTASPHLDATDGGFTVFGKITKGTNVLNLFVPLPPAHGIYRRSDALPVLREGAVTGGLALDDLILFNFAAKRDVALAVARQDSAVAVTWNSIAGATNALEFATAPDGAWTSLTNFLGDGKAVSVTQTPMPGSTRLYRVTLRY